MLLLTALALLTPAAGKVEHFVEVDGARYRVSVKDGIVTVNKKAAVVRYSIEERDAQRRAVELATGCRVSDELPNGARLRAKLDCSSGTR